MNSKLFIFSCIFSILSTLLCICHGEQDELNNGESVTEVNYNESDQIKANISFDEGGGNETGKFSNNQELTHIQGSCKALKYADLLQDPTGRKAMEAALLTLIPDYSNLTSDSNDKRKIHCSPRNVTENETITVQIINSTYLLSKLNSLKSDNVSTVNYCAVVMFFAPWCPFCAEAAPNYNALARAYPVIDVYAIDAIAYNNLNFRFGTVAVPNIIIFHNSKPVARYNNSERTLERLSSFVANVTGLVPTKTDILPMDYEGPVISVPTEENDYMLWLSYACIIIYLCYQLPRTSYAQQLWTLLGHYFGHTEHAHID